MLANVCVRRLVSLLAVVAVALASADATAAKHRPLPSRTRPVSVSSGVPYIAPWQTGFTRYSTQVFGPPFVGPLTTWTVPAGQWWRIIAVNINLSTSATVATRFATLIYSFHPPANGMVIGLTASIPASIGLNIYYSPNASAYSNIGDASFSTASSPIPDMLLAAGTQVTFRIQNSQIGDSVGGASTLLVETYTEDRGGLLVPAATPLTP